jgi:hypothetical protein
MKPFLSSVSPVWDAARSTANFNQARAIHPKQGTLRKYGAVKYHTGLQKTPCPGQFTSVFMTRTIKLSHLRFVWICLPKLFQRLAPDVTNQKVKRVCCQLSAICILAERHCLFGETSQRIGGR